MAATINSTQLRQLQPALTQAGNVATTANIAAFWRLLSGWGDIYASAAYQVLAQPTSFYGQVARNAWAAACGNSTAHYDKALRSGGVPVYAAIDL